MATFFCFSCGKDIQYKITKPASCPACGKLIKTTMVKAFAVPIPVSDTPSYQVVVPDHKGKLSKRYNVIPESKNLSRARIMEEDLVDSPSSDEDENDDETPLSEAYDANAAKQ